MKQQNKYPDDLIGGEFCKAPLDPKLLPQEGQELTPDERDALWRIFQEIGRCWDNLYFKATDSVNLKSSWLEFIEAKTKYEPTYVAEYSNAVSVVNELIEMYGEKKAFKLLFLQNGIPQDPPRPPTTRLEHAKRYVIDEFIRVNIVASGFKSFGGKRYAKGKNYPKGKNYKGYIGGSRYNIRARVRDEWPLPPEKK